MGLSWGKWLLYKLMRSNRSLIGQILSAFSLYEKTITLYSINPSDMREIVATRYMGMLTTEFQGVTVNRDL